MKSIFPLWLAMGLLLGVLAERPGSADDSRPMRSLGTIVRLDPRIDRLVPKDARIEVLAEGLDWSEGPVWVRRDGGYLLFSDIPRNSIMKWKEGQGISLFLKPAGYTGEGLWEPEPGTASWSAEPGTNGLLLDPQGRLVMCEHGNRRVSVLLREQDAIKKTLASHYQGKRLNSPNDGVFASNGDLYFTDPPYGLPYRFEDPRRELDHCGVYRLSGSPGRSGIKEGTVSLLTSEMTAPNGITFSPDEKTLYVAQSDPKQAIWKAFDVKDDGTLGAGRVFFDATQWVGKKPGLPDGLKTDSQGNLFATGPGGVLILAPDGTHLGTLETGQRTANCNWGDDGSVLYITADMYLCRIRLSTKGRGW